MAERDRTCAESHRRVRDYRYGRAPDREIRTAIYSDIRYSTEN